MHDCNYSHLEGQHTIASVYFGIPRSEIYGPENIIDFRLKPDIKISGFSRDVN